MSNSLNFSFGNAAQKTTGGGGFSFPTLTTSTAGGTSNFSFGTALATSQPSGTSPFSFGTTSTPAASSSTAATTTGGGLFSAATTNQQQQQQQQQTAAPGAGFLAPPASSASSSFSFSAPAPATTSTGFSSSFQLPTTISASTATPTLQFGGPTKATGAAPEPAKSAAPALQTFAFSTKPTTGTLAAAPGASLFTPAATTTTTITAAATTTTTMAAAFPILATGQTSAPSSTTTHTTATASLGLGVATTTAATTSVTAVTAATTTPASASLTTATTTSSATGVPVSGSSAATGGLSVAGLEEKVNKWMSELKEQEERLMRQAAHVNAWDQLLQQGHDQVQQLRLTLNNVKTDQNRLQAELDFIQGQQQELEQLIEPLETAAASTTPAQHQGDRQRENMHLVAQNLDSQLRQITDDLCKVIEHLNSSNSGSRATDPVNTVARVLSAHMDTLKWVDQNTALLSQKMDELSRTSDNKRRD